MKKKYAYVIGLLLLGICLTSFAISVSHFSTKEDKFADWMANVNDEVAINQILLPGTHDSGARLSIYDVSGKCQDLTIEEQLNLGVRFFDLRVKNIEDQLFIYHSFINQELMYEEVLNTVYTFLELHPSEAIIFSIKEESEPRGVNVPTNELIEQLCYKNLHKWYLEKNIPSIGELRGKIMLLARYDNNSAGLNLYDNWDDSATFDLNNDEVNFHIQDEYRLSENESKYLSIIDCIEYSSQNPTSFTINFCSGYINNIFTNALSTSQYINPLMIDYFNNDNLQPIGVMLFDFYSYDIAEALLG